MKMFIDDLYSKPPLKKYETNKIIYIHIDELGSIDSSDFSDYKTSNNRRYRYVFFIIDNFSKYTSAIPPKKKNSQTKTENFQIF